MGCREEGSSVLAAGERDLLMPTLSGVFAVLSEVFLEPEADVKVRLAQILAGCPTHCPGLDGLPTALAGMLSHCGPSQIQAMEFVRLFLHGNGNPTVHPYESVYTHGRLMAPECMEDLRALHEAADIRPRAAVSLPPDHLGLELEFLAFVLERIAEGEVTEERRWRVITETLLRRHLVPFGRHFARRLEEAKPDPYYASAGEALVHALHACTLVLGIEAEPPASR